MARPLQGIRLHLSTLKGRTVNAGPEKIHYGWLFQFVRESCESPCCAQVKCGWRWWRIDSTAVRPEGSGSGSPVDCRQASQSALSGRSMSGVETPNRISTQKFEEPDCVQPEPEQLGPEMRYRSFKHWPRLPADPGLHFFGVTRALKRSA